MHIKLFAGRLCGLLAACACVVAAGGRGDVFAHGQGRVFSQRGAQKVSAGGRKTAPTFYVALGDSTGVGVGARDGGGYVQRLHERIEHSRPGSRLVNLCASSASTADVLSGQAPRLVELKPTLVTLGVGANDLIRGVAADKFARDFEALVRLLREGTDAPIVVLNIPDISLAPAVPAYMRDHTRRHIVTFNQRLEEIAEQYDLPVIDLYGRSREFASHPEFFSADGIHPSDAGYEFWADLLWPHAERLAVKRPPRRAGRSAGRGLGRP